MENNEFLNVRIKIRTCYYFNDIIKLEDFDIDNVFIHEKSHENNLIYDISYKVLLEPNLYKLSLRKWIDLLEFVMVLDI